MIDYRKKRWFMNAFSYHLQRQIKVNKNLKAFGEQRSLQLVSPTQPMNNEIKQNSCPLCQGGHKQWKCSPFLGKSLRQRSTFARDNKLCCSCHQAGHRSKECMMDLKCVKKSCKKSHNVFLHIEKSEKSG